MGQDVKLHGGPWHGQVVTVEDGRYHFHLLAPAEEPMNWLIHPEDPTPIRKKEGTYSRIAGMPGNFEWDGWVTHD